jgi:RNA polymerase sigma factor (sigma-70 family)
VKFTAAHEPLSAEAFASHIVAAQAGDTAARDRIILSTMKLVYQRAAKIAEQCGRQDLIEDMIQAAVSGHGARAGGLMRAIERFDTGRGLAWSTYAATWIDKECRALRDEICGNGVSRATQSRAIGIRRVASQLSNPSPAEIRAVYEQAGRQPPSEAAVLHALSSWDAVSGEPPTDEGPLADEQIDHQQQLAALRADVASLPFAHRAVIESWLRLQSDSAVSSELGWSLGRVRRLRREAVARLR